MGEQLGGWSECCGTVRLFMVLFEADKSSDTEKVPGWMGKSGKKGFKILS